TADQVRGKLVIFAAAAPVGGRGAAGGGGGRARATPPSCRENPQPSTGGGARGGGGGGGGGGAGRGGRAGFGTSTALSEAAGVATIEGDQLTARTQWGARHTGTAFVKEPGVAAAEPTAPTVSLTTHA